MVLPTKFITAIRQNLADVFAMFANHTRIPYAQCHHLHPPVAPRCSSNIHSPRFRSWRDGFNYVKRTTLILFTLSVRRRNRKHIVPGCHRVVRGIGYGGGCARETGTRSSSVVHGVSFSYKKRV